MDIWIHPDLRYQQLPLQSSKYFLVTNNYYLKFNSVNGQFAADVRYNSIINTLNLPDSLYYYGWNHLILFNQVTSDVPPNTNIFINLKGSFSSASLLTTVAGVSNISLNKICFCNNGDTGTNCCDITTAPTWMDMWYRDLRIWDGSKINNWSVLGVQNL